MTSYELANHFLNATVGLLQPGAQTEQLHTAQQALDAGDLKSALIELDGMNASFDESPQCWLAAAARHFLR